MWRSPGRPGSTSRGCCAARSASPTARSARRPWRTCRRCRAAAVDAVEAVLKGKTLVDAGAALAVTRSLPHGHVAAVHADGPAAGASRRCSARPCRERDLAYALIISRVVRPAPKLSTAGLVGRRDPRPGPGRGRSVHAMTSTRRWTGCWTARTTSRRSWRPGTCARAASPCSTCPPPGWRARHCELAAFGYSRDGKRGRQQIEYGLLTDPRGPPGRGPGLRRQHRRPDHVHPRPSTRSGTSSAWPEMIMVGDRGMITSARIRACEELERHVVDHLPARPGDPQARWRTTGRCSCPCSMSRTWPRSATRTTPASG